MRSLSFSVFQFKFNRDWGIVKLKLVVKIMLICTASYGNVGVLLVHVVRVFQARAAVQSMCVSKCVRATMS